MTKLTTVRVHDLKIYPEFFSAVCTGIKRAELRKNDRGYRVGDVLHLCEFSKTTGHTGEYIDVIVTHIADVSDWLSGYVLLSITPQENDAAPVLPKQPELVDLSQQVEILNRILNWILKELPVPTQKASAMAIRLSSVINVISDLEIPAPAQPVIPERALNTTKLINKFYERYPLKTFANDCERAEALGYFMAGAELQCFGDFIAYGDPAQEQK